MTATGMVSVLAQAGFGHIAFIGSPKHIAATGGEDFVLDAYEVTKGKWYTRIMDNYTGDTVSCVLVAEDESLFALQGVRAVTPHNVRVA